MDWLAPRLLGMLNFSVTVVVHWPVPVKALSLPVPIVAGPIVEPVGPKRSMVPACRVPEKVPWDPPQPCSPPLPLPKFSAGAAVVATGVAGLVCWPEALYALPH